MEGDGGGRKLILVQYVTGVYRKFTLPKYTCFLQQVLMMGTGSLVVTHRKKFDNATEHKVEFPIEHQTYISPLVYNTSTNNTMRRRCVATVYSRGLERDL